MESILNILNQFSPTGLVALSLLIVYIQVKNSEEIKLMKSNHLPHIQDSSSNNGEKLVLIIEEMKDFNESIRRVENNLLNHSSEEIRLMNDVNMRIAKLERKKK